MRTIYNVLGRMSRIRIDGQVVNILQELQPHTEVGLKSLNLV